MQFSTVHVLEALPHILFYYFHVSSFSVSLIHLDLSFVQGNKNGSIHILLHADLQLNYHFVENTVFFPLDGFSSFGKDQVTIGICGLSGSSVLFH